MAKEHRESLPEIERRFVTIGLPEIEARIADSGKMLFGYTAMFNSMSLDLGWFREKIAPGAFLDTINEDDIRALFNHNPSAILGRSKAQPVPTLRMKEDPIGLYYEADLADTSVANDVRISVSRGDISGNSFGFQTLADSWDYSDEEMPIRTLIKVRLFDIGPVTYPAYPDTTVAARSMDAWLKGNNLPPKSVRRKLEMQLRLAQIA